MNIIEKIASEEGFSTSMYKCPADKWTIGYGFNLEALEMPEEVAELWLKTLIDDIEMQLDMFDFYDDAEPHIKLVFIDMSYQMGVKGMLKFSNMIDAIERLDYETAANELLDSKYARQTPARAKRNADIIRSGEV